MCPAEYRRATAVAVRRVIEALDQITGLLKLQRRKVSGRDVDAPEFQAGLVPSAGSYLIGPKCQTTRVGLPVEEVVIMLAGEVLRIINHIRCRLHCAVDDRHRGD